MISILRRVATRPAGFIPLIWLGIVSFCALFPDLVMTHDPNGANFDALLQGPTSEHWFGTDDLGRDTFSRLVDAARPAALAGLQAVGLSLLIGLPIGLFVGYAGGWWDRIVMRIVDAIFSLPGLLLAFSIVAILGPGLTNAMYAVGILFALRVIRLTRGMVLSVREEPFIEAAHLSGAPTSAILSRYLLPNMLGPLIVQTTISFAAVLLIEAALSFLGLGVQQPDATWGSMLRDARSLQRDNPWIPWPPGLAITFTVLAFNTLGDTLRDVVAEGSGGKAKAARRGQALGLAEGADAAAADSTDADDAALLSVRDLTVTVPTPEGRVEAVKQLSFSMQPGEIVGLVGESGSGKTLTALSVAGLLPRNVLIEPSSSIVFDGHQLVGRNESEMAAIRGTGVGMVFQDPTASLNPALTVGYQLTEPLRIHHGLSKAEANDRAVELLDRVGVKNPRERLRDHPHQFSGGMAQRVMIAMALASEPSLIIADEPTTALDVTTQRQVLELLVELCEDLSMAMLFITHDLGVVAEVCDRAVVMLKGEAVERNDVFELFAQPSHDYTRGLLAAVPLLDGERDRLAVPNRDDDGNQSAGNEVAARPAPQLPSISEAGGFTGEQLRVDALNVEFRGGGAFSLHRETVHAVRDVSFEIGRGEVYGLVGESGSGKTTTGRCILGFQEPTAGTIALGDDDITELRSRDINGLHRRIQAVFQNPIGSLNPAMTIEHVLAEPLRRLADIGDRAAARERSAALLESVWLPESVLDKRPLELSGGMAQRVSIARALASDPSLIVLDEAVSALDVATQAQVINLLADLRDNTGVSFLFIGHDLAVVRHLCDRVGVMSHGELVEEGTAEAVCHDPQHEYTKRLLAAVPVPDPNVKRVRHDVQRR